MDSVAQRSNGMKNIVQYVLMAMCVALHRQDFYCAVLGGYTALSSGFDNVESNGSYCVTQYARLCVLSNVVAYVRLLGYIDECTHTVCAHF